MAKNKNKDGKNKTNNNNNGGNGGKKQSGGGNKGARGVPALDAAALAYAKLLADPCRAALVHPTYAGGEGGYLIRVDSWATYGFVGTDTSGYFHWTPGYMAADNHELFVVATAAPATPAAPTAQSGAPGKVFLTAQASAARCVAACVRVTYPGAEASRAGRVHLGITNGGLVNNGVAVAPDGVATALPHYIRTPATELELRWKPNDADQLFFNPALAATQPEDRQRRAALTVAWAGLPAATGLVFHMTAIYEWQPLQGTGLGVPEGSRSRSSNTLDQVLNVLERAGEKFVSGVTAGAMGGFNNYLAAAYGLMPSGMRTNAARAIRA